MNDLSEARTQIEAADAAASALRRQLSSAHGELLELEHLGDRSDVGLLVIDRADDLRRHLSGSVQGLTDPVRPALEVTELVYFNGAISGEIDVNHARTMTGVILQTARETRHLQLAIDDAARSLQQVVSASPADPWLPERLNRSLQRSTSSLGHARRGAHRVGEDLAMIARSLRVDIASLEIAEHLSIEGLADRRREPVAPVHRPEPMTAPSTGRGATP